MTTRKKWRLKMFPTFAYTEVLSKVEAYRRVEKYRNDYVLGKSRVHHVNVEVDVGDGWCLYERIIFSAVAW